MLPVLLALCAAALFALGTVLQQRVAMSYPDGVAHGAWFMLHLARHPAWLAGIAATLVGFGFHAAALAGGELVVVQPILSLTLVLALPLGARLSAQRITAGDVLASLVVALALAAFLLLSDPVAGLENPSNDAWLIAGGAVVLIGAALTAAGLHRRAALKALLVGTAAGILFGLHGALTKGMVAQFDHGLLGPLESWQLYAVLALGWASMTIAQISLQAGDLPPAIAAQSIASPIAAIVLGLTLFEETIHDSALGIALSVIALAVMLAGIAALARRPDAAPVEPGRCDPA